MRGNARRAVGRLAVPLSLLLAGLAGCAPHHVAAPELDLGGRRAAYLRALAARESPAAQVESEITLWARAQGGQRLGASGTLVLAPPDGMRLKLDSMFGTALDLGARADSVKAVMPSRRVAVAVDAVRDTLGIRAPGVLAYRALSGAWRPPPHAAWRPIAGALEARWAEGADSVTLAVNAEGLPQRVAWRTAAGPDWIIQYVSWTRVNGVSWPTAIRCQDPRGRLTLSTRLGRVQMQARPSPGRLAVHAPADTEWVGWRRFQRTLEEIESWLE